jgi:hypothetical protein
MNNKIKKKKKGRKKKKDNSLAIHEKVTHNLPHGSAIPLLVE